MMQVTVQRIVAAQRVRRVAIDGVWPGGKISVSTLPSAGARTAEPLTWLWAASALIKRALSTLVWFWNIPALGAEETLESRYLRSGRFN